MAYFPNGTAGEILDEQCHNCLHGTSDGILCPVAHVQVEYNYDQLEPWNKPLRAAMNLLINEQGICQMKAAIEKAGVKLDLSGKDQLDLLDPAECSCRMSDAWRCANDLNLPSIACTCACHRSR